MRYRQPPTAKGHIIRIVDPRRVIGIRPIAVRGVPTPRHLIECKPTWNAQFRVRAIRPTLQYGVWDLVVLSRIPYSDDEYEEYPCEMIVHDDAFVEAA